MKKQLLFLVLMLLPMVAWADDSGSCGDNVTYSFNEATHTLTISGTGAMKDYEWPWDRPWDSYRSQIVHVIIESGVTSIGHYAFWVCTGLTSVTIGNSVTCIGYNAFGGCYSLTSVTIPNSVISIENVAFAECSGLTSVTIPNSVTSIGAGAFEKCSGLTFVTISNSVTSIGNGAFSGCSGLTSVIIPNSVTSIGYSAFSGCSSLISVTIGNSVGSIGHSVFEGSSSLISIVVDSGNNFYDSREGCNAIIQKSNNELVAGCKNTIIPNGVTSIGLGAFSGCSGLTLVTIPNSVTSIGSYAFQGCSGLTSMTIPSSVTNIQNDAFHGCSSLTSVTIPNSVTSIGEYAFYNCTSLASLTIPNSVTSIGKGAFKGTGWYNSQPDGILYLDKWLIDYKGEQPMGKLVIAEGTKAIAGTVFRGCSGLTSVTIPNSVTTIGNYAFWECTGLTSVTIGNSVTSIGPGAFEDCSSLNSVSIPNSVTSIGNGAFSGCSGLTSVTIPNSVKSIENYVFRGCSGLTSVTIPNSVTSIGGAAFDGCSGLMDVYCYAEAVPYTNSTAFGNSPINEATLHVPQASIIAYKAKKPWSDFGKIVALSDGNLPATGDGGADFGTDIDNGKNLNGNVIGNIYYNIGSGDGGYNAAEGCIVVNTPTSDDDIDGKDIFGEEFKDHFTGIVFKVETGSGVIKVKAQTTGNMMLKVKIGSNVPFSMMLSGTGEAMFPYSVSEPTYVYIYGGIMDGSRSLRAAGDNALKIYGVSWQGNSNGIDAVNETLPQDDALYNLKGQRVTTPQPGQMYIRNRKKVFFK